MKTTKPRIPLTNPAFVYVNAAATDISVRIKAEIERLKKPEKKLILFERKK